MSRGHIHILYPDFFKPGVQIMLNVFPNRVAVGFDNHAAFGAGIIHQFRFPAYVRIPFGKIFLHGGDCFHHFFLLCHTFLLLIFIRFVNGLTVSLVRLIFYAKADTLLL